MGLNRKKATEVVKKEGEGEYRWENLKPGDYECRLAYVADLGLQAKEYQGEFSGNFQQIALGVEVIGEGLKTEEEDGTITEEARILWTKPIWCYETLTEKGAEIEFYSLFVSDCEAGDIPDWEAQLGKPVSAAVINVQGKGENKDKVYDNVKGLDKIPEKYQDGVGPLSVSPGIGDSEDSSNFVTAGLFGLPKYIWEKRILPEIEEEGDQPTAEMASEDRPY